jgi:hypothetical protein
MDLSVAEGVLALGLGGFASIASAIWLARVSGQPRSSDPRQEMLRRTDVVWTAVPTLLLLLLLGGVVYRLP